MLTRTLAAGALALLSTQAFAQDGESCGSVAIADMNWNSATLLANVDHFILTHGFGCDAELVPGDTMPSSTSMIEKGKPDIVSELYSNSLKDVLDQGVAEKRIRYAGQSLKGGAEEGFWIPRYMVEQEPSLATIDGIIANAKLFTHPEDPSLSAFYGCPAGWFCQITAGHLFNALELEQAGFEMIDPGSGAGLSGSLAKAYDRQQPWFGYYWAPTAILGKYDMVKVDFGTGVDAEHYLNCISKDDCLEPKVTMYPRSPVHTIVTERFAAQAPAAMEYLNQRSFTNNDMNTLLAWMEDNQADGEMVTEHFLANYESSWSEWVTPAAASRIKQAIGQ